MSVISNLPTIGRSSFGQCSQNALLNFYTNDFPDNNSWKIIGANVVVNPKLWKELHGVLGCQKWDVDGEWFIAGGVLLHCWRRGPSSTQKKKLVLAWKVGRQHSVCQSTDSSNLFFHIMEAKKECYPPPPPCPTNAVSNEHFHLDRIF